MHRRSAVHARSSLRARPECPSPAHLGLQPLCRLLVYEQLVALRGPRCSHVCCQSRRWPALECVNAGAQEEHLSGVCGPNKIQLFNEISTWRLSRPVSLIPARQSSGHHSCCRLQGGTSRRLLRLLLLDIAGAAADGSRPRCRACPTTCTDGIQLLAVQVLTLACRKQWQRKRTSGNEHGASGVMRVRLLRVPCAVLRKALPATACDDWHEKMSASAALTRTGETPIRVHSDRNNIKKDHHGFVTGGR